MTMWDRHDETQTPGEEGVEKHTPTRRSPASHADGTQRGESVSQKMVREHLDLGKQKETLA